MPKKPAITPTEHLHIKLEANLKSRLDLMLYSYSEKRVPKGAYKAIIEKLLTEYFAKIDSVSTKRNREQF